MKFKRILLVLAVFCLLGYFHDKNDRQEVPSRQDTPVTEATIYAEPTRPWDDLYTPTQAPYSSHILMNARGMGDCKALTGDLLINIILVNDQLSTWTDADAWDFHEDVLVANDRMISDAAAWGVELNVQLNYLSCYVDDTMDISDFQDWVKKALSALNLPETGTIAALQEMYQVDNAAIVFAVNRDGRSFAMPQNMNQGLEYAVLYREQGDYRHELFHVYGAKDYYYPDSLQSYAELYFSDSIMLDSSGNAVDSLTAYLIGWTDYLSPDARALLDATAWITPEYMAESNKAEVITGHATIRYDAGTYTGYLDDGIPNGWGTMVWDSGDYYEGDWVNGTIEGYGTYIWANNSRYTGNFRNGLLNGYGTYTYADGTTITGQWRDNDLLG